MSERGVDIQEWLLVLDERKRKEAERLLGIISEIESLSSQARGDATLLEDINRDTKLSGVDLSIKTPGIWKPFSPAELLHRLYKDTVSRLDKIRTGGQYAPGSLGRAYSRSASLAGGFHIAVSGKELNAGEILDQNLETEFLKRIDYLKNRLEQTIPVAKLICKDAERVRTKKAGSNKEQESLLESLIFNESLSDGIYRDYLETLDKLINQIFSSPESVIKLYKSVSEIRKMSVEIRNIHIQTRNLLLSRPSLSHKETDPSEIDTEPGPELRNSSDSLGLAGINDTEPGVNNG